MIIFAANVSQLLKVCSESTWFSCHGQYGKQKVGTAATPLKKGPPPHRAVQQVQPATGAEEQRECLRRDVLQGVQVCRGGYLRQAARLRRPHRCRLQLAEGRRHLLPQRRRRRQEHLRPIGELPSGAPLLAHSQTAMMQPRLAATGELCAS